MKTLIAILLAISLGLLCGGAAEQSASEMQAAMNSAGTLSSTANVTEFKTPLLTYRAFYAAYIAGNSKALYSCYTDTFRKAELEGDRIPTDVEFALLDTIVQQDGFSGFHPTFFAFTPDPVKPKIVVTITATDSQQRTRNEQSTLTMIDTPSGWKIDDVETTEVK